jgi:recombination protein RecA
VKNKVAPPFREAEFDIMYGEGISKLGELVDLGVQLGLVEKSGSWFSMGEIRLGQGRDNAKQYFKDHPDEAAKLDTAIRANAYKLLSNQALIAAKAAGRVPVEEPAPTEDKASSKDANEPKVLERDMDNFEELIGLDISAEDFEG